MNSLYVNNEILNHLDRRLIDCFCEQNESNSWLQVCDVASWIFETNKPNQFQKNYTLRKLNSLVGPKNTAKCKRSAFEASYDPDIEFSLLYRLKNPTAYIKHKAPASLDVAIDNAVQSTNTQQEQVASSEVDEFPF